MEEALKKPEGEGKNELSADRLYINPELSWLEFNARVLEEALSKDTPLLESLKFLSIFSSNLDEFFMVRVAGLKQLIKEGFEYCETPDGSSCQAVLDAIRHRVEELVAVQYNHLNKAVLPELEKHRVELKKMKDLSDSQKEYLAKFFEELVFPVLTPLAVDPAHPFPFLSNQSLYLLVTFKQPKEQEEENTRFIGFVEIPEVIPRLIKIKSKDDKHLYILLEEIIKTHLSKLFLGFEIDEAYPVRVTRNLDYTLMENEVVDLLKSVQKEVFTRELQEVVRLEVDPNLPKPIRKTIKRALNLTSADIYAVESPLNVCGLMRLYSLSLDHLKDPPFNPRLPKELAKTKDIFSLISSGDLLVHHPFDSFYAVVDLLNTAAFDRDVLAIKQTLYRTSGDSPVIDALIAAAENGKQVTAVVELKARFDEKNNIIWARRLEKAGVNVVFGFVGFKTHGKATLIVRKEGKSIKRYIHLSTGNYNSTSAKLYTDIGLFTDDDDIGHDISAMFNLLTGFNILNGEKRLIQKSAFPTFKKIFIAPIGLRETVLGLIEKEIDCAKKSGNGLIIAKMNSLTDKEITSALYRASQAGVKIKLIVRGMCCLRPGIKGVSDNIEVVSIVDRFLEHSRIYYFQAGDKEKIFLASADWMPRNMDKRIEIMFPVEEQDIKNKLKDILNCYLKDNVKARILHEDGTYRFKSETTDKKEEKLRVQTLLIELVRQRGIKSLPYDLAIRYNKKGELPVDKKKIRKIK